MYIAKSILINDVKATRLSLNQCAKEMNISRNTLTKALDGDRVTMQTAYCISEYLGYDIEYYFKTLVKEKTNSQEIYLVRRKSLVDEFEKLGISKNKFKDEVRMHNQAIAKALGGEEVRIVTAIKLAKYFGMKVSELFMTDMNKYYILPKKTFNKEEIEFLGMTLTEFGKEVGMSSGFVTEFLQRKRHVNQPLAEKICEVMDLEFDDIFEYEEI